MVLTLPVYFLGAEPRDSFYVGPSVTVADDPLGDGRDVTGAVELGLR